MPETQTTAHIGLIAVPERSADLPHVIADIHAIGLPPGAITAIGPTNPAAQQALKLEGDPPASLPADAATRVSLLLDPVHRHDVFGAALGTTIGLLGGFVALAVPGIGPFLLAGGAELLVACEGLAGLFGASLGLVLAAATDTEALARHEEMFKRELAEGRWILLVSGSPEELRRAGAILSRHPMRHVDHV
jgi:hypothetical protein